MSDKTTLLGIGALAMLMFFAYAIVITVLPTRLDPQVQGVILGILGSGGFTVVISYFFGSSSGSANKTEMLNHLAANPRSAHE